MVLIDSRMLDKLKSDAPVTRAEETRKVLSGLDVDMKQVLERGDLTDEEKVRLYTTNLQKFFQVRNRTDPLKTTGVSTEAPTTPTRTSFPSAVEKQVLGALPAIYRNRAEHIISHIKESPNAGWTDQGQLIWQNNVVDGSNITNLILDIVKKKQR